MLDEDFTIKVTKNDDSAFLNISKSSSPKTVALVENTVKRNPICRIVNDKGAKTLFILLKIGRIGREDSVREIKEKGTVAYYPASNLLAIYVEEQLINYDVNIIGHTKDLDIFQTFRTGEAVKLSLKDE